MMETLDEISQRLKGVSFEKLHLSKQNFVYGIWARQQDNEDD
jgi:hypothetical protein